ncbi:MAG TPA: stage V sporulation protein D, partial [Eubacteriaceae bacterium]|nr:stage V sporulation protein D [Eubacteriaceae bacterium]
DKLSQAQISQLIGEIPLTASRGDIYDRNDNILAKDSSASQIYVRPSLVEEKEKVAELFSQIFEEKSKEEYLEILNEDTDRLVLIQRKVDNQVALEIEEKEYRGVEVSEDKKRYYTNGNFASYILGFTGSDHQGLYGIEGVFERELKGQDGLLVYEKDGRSQRLPSGYQTRIEPLPGNNIVLTIDSMIQHYLESEAQNSLDELNAKRVIAIAMDPNNGEVLGMTAKPDYDLNNPRTVSSEMIERLHLEENTLGEQQLEMWQNPAVALNYEPGSTFKIITAG